MYCLQQWYGPADEALEDTLHESQALRDFVGTDLSGGSVPDAWRSISARKRPRRTKLFLKANSALAKPFWCIVECKGGWMTQARLKRA